MGKAHGGGGGGARLIDVKRFVKFGDFAETLREA